MNDDFKIELRQFKAAIFHVNFMFNAINATHTHNAYLSNNTWNPPSIVFPYVYIVKIKKDIAGRINRSNIQYK